MANLMKSTALQLLVILLKIFGALFMMGATVFAIYLWNK